MLKKWMLFLRDRGLTLLSAPKDDIELALRVLRVKEKTSNCKRIVLKVEVKSLLTWI